MVSQRVAILINVKTICHASLGSLCKGGIGHAKRIDSYMVRSCTGRHSCMICGLTCSLSGKELSFAELVHEIILRIFYGVMLV